MGRPDADRPNRHRKNDDRRPGHERSRAHRGSPATDPSGAFSWRASTASLTSSSIPGLREILEAPANMHRATRFPAHVRACARGPSRAPVATNCSTGWICAPNSWHSRMTPFPSVQAQRWSRSRARNLANRDTNLAGLILRWVGPRRRWVDPATPRVRFDGLEWSLDVGLGLASLNIPQSRD